MKIVTTFHSSSSVLASVKCRLGARDIEHLVVAKLNRIEVYSITSQGLQFELRTEIWGKVVTIKAIPIPGSSRSNLLLFIAHPDPELVFFSYTEPEGGTPELIPKKQLPLYERTPRPAEFFNNVLLHPSGRLAVVSCYTGKLKFINLRAGNYDNDFDVTLPELNVLSLSFLPTSEEEYALAILYLDHQGRIQLHARDINVADLELSIQPSTLLNPTVISNKIIPDPTYIVPQLIPVPAPDVEDEDDDNDDDRKSLGGVFVVGGKKILLFELAPMKAREKQRGKRRRLEEKKKSTDISEAAKAKDKERERESRKRKPSASVEWPWNEISAWCAVDSDSRKFFIGDIYGKLSLLSADNLKDVGLILVPLGETSSPTTISYLTNQYLYIGSHLANSQLIQISETPLAAHSTPTLPIPPSIISFPPNHLISPKTAYKGKGKAAVDDMDIDDDDTPDTSKGCVIKTIGTFINVLETYSNIAPIIDAAMVDTDGSGQPQIITCSGGHGSGSINVVRKGADFEELAVVPVEDVVRLWPIRNTSNDVHDSKILASTLHKTHLLRIDDNGDNATITYMKDGMDLITDQSTLTFSNILTAKPGTTEYLDSAIAVQVTPKGVLLLEFNHALGGYSQIAQYPQPGSKVLENVEGPIQVVCASASRTQVVLALTGGYLVLLKVANKAIEEQIFSPVSNEISAVSCEPSNAHGPFSQYVTVAYWETNEVEVFRIKQQHFVSVTRSEPHPAVIRSVMLFNFGTDKGKGCEYLLVGLGDGSAVYYNWKTGSGARELKDKKVIPLGNRPVSLTSCEADGKLAVLASGDRSTMLSWEKERLSQYPIMSKGVISASRLNTRSFCNALILATSKNLSVGRARNLDKMHIRSIPFGPDDPRRIVYEPNLKLFGLACTKTEPGRIGEVEITTSCFKVVDDTSFSVLSQFNCAPDEEISAITSISLSTGSEQKPFFCIGIYTYKTGEKEPSSGRLLVFTPFQAGGENNVALTQVCSIPVKGCVYSLVVGQDKIFAAVNSSVIMFQLSATDDEPSPSYELKQLSEWNHNYLVVCLAVYEDYIVAADQISSISLLMVKDSVLKSVARDYGPLWPVSVEALSNDHVIGGNDAFNLFTFTLSQNLGRAVLERDGSYHLGDFVTKFIRGSLSSSDASNHPSLVQEAVFFTSSGHIGVVIGITDDQLSLHLTELQRNLGGVIPAVGGVSHARFRAPRNSRGKSDADSAAFGFMDGDFLEQFLALIGSQEQVDKVITGQSEPERLTIGVDELQEVLENLQGLH
ncbi:CPSF A subunit region-domain-containing protein [Cyathus striatus]|nr:CPSF A subunit region-domain-containing protein [Cyathus striatus]